MKEIIEKFIGYLRYERNASPETVDDYGGDVRLFEEFLTPPGGATLPLEEVDHRVIREFVSWLYDRKLQKVTVARKLSALRHLYRYLLLDKFIAHDPTLNIDSPKQWKVLPKALGHDEIDVMLRNTRPASNRKQAEAVKRECR